VKLAAARRISQIAFLALFLFLLIQTGFHGSFVAGQSDTRIPYPVRWFLEIDPLIAVGNALSNHSLYRGLLWSLAILIPTFFLGRFFCGWICPLGTLNHGMGSLRSTTKLGVRGIDSNRYKRWQTVKYYLLFGLLAAALAGSGIFGLFDPVSLLVRSLALAVWPWLSYAVNHETLWSVHQPYFRQGVVVGLILATILALNLRVTRFWCRAVCPLGGLLGLLSRWSILRLEKRESRCGDCNRCLLHCQGGDDPIPGVPWRQAECHLCLNCVADCPDGGIAFRFFPAKAGIRRDADLQRRRTLTSLASGAALVPLFRSVPGFQAEIDRFRIRPPGAVEETEFVGRCIRCAECMTVCPNHALHPSFVEAGVEGLWSPILVSRIGYCEPNCTLCGQACPTGALREFTPQEKGWIGGSNPKPIRVGTAFFDRGRCLPWAMGTECIVCEEWCPTTPKAIYLRPADVADREGGTHAVRQPWMDPTLCVGCGACEHACPVKDGPAVYVTSAGESRSTANQMMLSRRGAAPAVLLPDTAGGGKWRKTKATRLFAAADLWKYVDGDAERYARGGVQRTLTAGYRHQSGAEAVVDVHEMATPEQARRFFDSEPSVGSRPVDLGGGGRSYGESLTFYRGRYFVRLTAYSDAGDALFELAKTLDALLG
jgi:polyferredoxin